MPDYQSATYTSSVQIHALKLTRVGHVPPHLDFTFYEETNQFPSLPHLHHSRLHLNVDNEDRPSIWPHRRCPGKATAPITRPKPTNPITVAEQTCMYLPSMSIKTPPPNLQFACMLPLNKCPMETFMQVDGVPRCMAKTIVKMLSA